MKKQACSTVEELASEARGWEEATMPLLPSTGDLRLLKSMMWNGSLGLLGAMAAQNSMLQPIELLYYIALLHSNTEADRPANSYTFRTLPTCR